MSDNHLYTYYFSVHDRDGSALTLHKRLTRFQFIMETGIDPVTNKCIIYINVMYTFIKYRREIILPSFL